MLPALANLGGFLRGIAVIGGFLFSVIRIRQYREAKLREIAPELL